MKKLVGGLFLFYILLTTFFVIYLYITPDCLTCYSSDKAITINTPVFINVNLSPSNVQNNIQIKFLYRTNKIYIPKKASSVLCELKIGAIPLKKVKISILESNKVWVSGKFVGIKLMTDGILVIGYSYVSNGSNSTSRVPAKEAGIQIGDKIVYVNGQKVKDCSQLFKMINSSGGKSLVFVIKRGQTYKQLKVKPLLSNEGVYKIGLWVRDGTSGIGTVTFVDTKRKVFGALGHGISDIDTGILLDVKEGQIYAAEIVDIRKNNKSEIGEVVGKINENCTVGDVVINTPYGIYGKIIQNSFWNSLQSMEIARLQDIHVGSAYILSEVSGNVERFEIKIERILPLYRNSTKAFVIMITDKRLLQLTSGIVQGMSGSPIIQDNKLVGAVTHVFLKEPEKGYGVFIDNMLNITKHIK
ncbi:stage IV sporulation protein B [Caldicellulosiruptor acetigenus I77R1B]|uniref:Stage IV sporulation protein B n=1 Tax=Caldicellulosiruptor acetigenus (strain ATCC 700853 / DSM 12137 / I77R1B) TaxID=632335 RepID=E4S7T9_CALA7|nr:SpoIVB peptidase [Caldicellulosiruptor acetigenus]ADQ40829.1 stage IV sporulation protein B [Caldicellulosiruptor acetigenus I77R1B]